MPITAEQVGQLTEPVTTDIDARWIMSFAAGIKDSNPLYMDTAANKVIAHPVFPVCFEWPVILKSIEMPGAEIEPEEHNTGIHSYHDIHINRLVGDGDRLTTTATVIGVKEKSNGAHQTMRLDTYDADGKLVCQTYQLGIAMGMKVVGEACIEELPDPPDFSGMPASDVEIDIPISAEAAHVYSECARIWSPIHSDREIALSVNLPDIVLHGTATLAYAVTALVNRCLDADPRRIRRVGCRFSAMVLMPSIIKLEVLALGEDRLRFEVYTEDGQCALQDGFLCWGRADSG